MAETPPQDVTRPEIDLAELYTRLVQPQVDASERMRRSVAGDVGSLAWTLTDHPQSPGEQLRQLIELTNATWNGGGPAIGPRIEEQLWRLGNTVTSANDGLGKVIYDRLGNILSTISDPHTPSTDELLKRLDGIAKATGTTGTDITDVIAKAVQQVLDSDTITDAAGYEAAFNDLAHTFEQGGLPAPFGIGPVAGVVGTALRAIGPWLGRAAVSLGATKAPAVLGTAGAFLAPVLAPIAGLAVVETLLEQESGRDDAGILPGLRHKYEEYFEGMTKGLIDAVNIGDPSDLSKVEERAAAALASAVKHGLSAHLLSIVAERLAPGKELGIRQIAGFIGDMGAFQPISRTMWGHLVDASIGRPLDQVYNMKFPTRIPPFGEILAMARKHEYASSPPDAGGIPQQYAIDMSKQGIPYEWVRHFWDYQWADPRLTDIVRMAEVAIPDTTPNEDGLRQCLKYGVDPTDADWWFRLKFMKAGYDRSDIDVLVQIVRARMASTDTTRLTTQFRAAFRQGRLTEDDLRFQLKELKHDALSVERMVEEVQQQRATDHMTDMLGIYADRLRTDTMTPDDFVMSVNALHADPAPAQAFIDLHLQRRFVRIANEEDKAVVAAARQAQTELVNGYKQQYRAGLIPEDVLLANMLAVGVGEELARAVVQTEVARRLPKFNPDRRTPEQELLEQVNAQLQRAYIAQYQGGQLNEEQLRANLQAIGRSPDLAAAIVATEMARKVKALSTRQDAESKAAHGRLQTAYTAALTNQYRKGLIDAPAFVQGLVAAGIDVVRATALAAAEQAKKGELVELPPLVQSTGPSGPKI